MVSKLSSMFVQLMHFYNWRNMKKLMTLGLLASSFVFADEGSEVVSIMKAPIADCEAPVVEASYGYYCAGLGPLPLPAPLVGVGRRYQNGHHGFDGSLQVSSFFLLVNMAKINANYLYYFNPNLKSQFYLGAGVGLAGVAMLSNDPKRLYLSPQLVVGKQYTNKEGSFCHLQAEITTINLDLTRNHPAFFPAVILSYGVSF
jgi:hypothetical protein